MSDEHMNKVLLLYYNRFPVKSHNLPSDKDQSVSGGTGKAN